MDQPSTDELIAAILNRSRTIAVVGMSRQQGKAAHDVPARLIAAGFRVIPVNPLAEEIDGQRCYASLLAVPEPIDLVDVFRPAADAPAVAADAVAVGASALWLQLGITSSAARDIASQAHIDYVEDRCIGVEAARLRIDKRDDASSNQTRRPS